ncbi:hypothetical protein LSH36_427g02045 [Paralvinella palmiformis]|uniref:Uncharacterized protein n=1 Tax=Paralvinella palmiformis TaxID=53620 RepID=A0AAD9JCE4_9ANNE|nr:hypothetical protein LSH36_427g02045 [Paralvinella palmiformis]
MNYTLAVEDISEAPPTILAVGACLPKAGLTVKLRIKKAQQDSSAVKCADRKKAWVEKKLEQARLETEEGATYGAGAF